MKQPKLIAVAVLAATALTALAATPSASATTLTVGGVAQNQAVTLHLTLRTGTSSLTTDTFRVTANTCTEATAHGETETPFTTAGTAAIRGAIRTVTVGSAATPCTEGNPTVHRAGTLSIQARTSGSNGTVLSSGLEQTVPSPFGTIICTTSGTDIGELTGGVNVIDIRAVIACTGVGTVRWTGTFSVTSPANLGVTE